MATLRSIMTTTKKKSTREPDRAEKSISMIEMLTNDTERNGLVAAFEDLRAGRVRSLAEIEADLEKERDGFGVWRNGDD